MILVALISGLLGEDRVVKFNKVETEDLTHSTKLQLPCIIRMIL